MKYTLAEIMSMLDGHNYYSPEQVMYVYYKSNGDEENAIKYKELCDEQINGLKERAKNMKFEDEIKLIQDDIIVDEKPPKISRAKTN
jgi:hypothetical protein